MAKFVIECPSCGRFAEASTGFFARKKIDCACGYVINVKTDKLTSKVCPHCGNTVVYDQSKGEHAKCPVCHEQLLTRDSMATLAEFTCPSCSCKLSASKNAATYVCPLCDTRIDVQERIKKEEVKKQGLASVIKYEGGNDTFVWKHPIEDFNLGSQLIVHESQEAIFFRDGRALDLFGAGRYTLATQNIPLLEELYKLPLGGAEVFHSEVYFVNLTTQMGIKWGTDSKVRLFDPASGLHIELGACGNFSLRVIDSRKLLVKLVGTASGFTQNEVMGDPFKIVTVVGKFKALVMNKVKSNLARVIKENDINILEVDSYMDVISEKLRLTINETLEEYGLTMPEFFITSILTPDDDADFQRLKKQFAERTLLTRQQEIAKAETTLKAIEAQGQADVMRIKAQAEADAYVLKGQADVDVLKMQGMAEADIIKMKGMADVDVYKAQAMAEAEEMRAKGFNYQQETARNVSMEAMKNGITGNGTGGSSLGDLAGLGVTLGAMGGVIGMTKEAMAPIMQDTTQIGAGVVAAVDGAWNCTCGCKNITSKFCPECGTRKPEPQTGWDCVCGCKNITSKFCPECGTKKPEAPATWDCTCGCKGISSKFCPECGTKRPEAPATWDCPDCGNKAITAKFCPECGHKRED